MASYSVRLASYSVRNVVPAHGKTVSGASIKRALKSGAKLDFSDNMSGSYVSVGELRKGDTLNVRYNNDRDVAVITV